MSLAKIYSESFLISSKLAEFGCSINELQDVALSAVAARNEATALHPINAPGMFSYMEGVAALRLSFLQIDGWEVHRWNGVEGVRNKELGLIILFQNVDTACGIHQPQAISQKGDAVHDLVDNPTGFLWEEMAQEVRATENSEVWFFCVASNGENVRAELSRPREIKNGNFGALAERIFVIQDDDWLPEPDQLDHGHPADGIDDIDVFVSKK